MKKILLAIIATLSLASFADVSIDIIQDSANVAISFSPFNGGAYVEILGCNSIMLTRAVVMAETSFSFAVDLCCSVYVRWTPIVISPSVNIELIDGATVRIPGGWYPIGADADDVTQLQVLGAPSDFINSCIPQRWVFVDTFDIMVSEVTCSVFSQFIAVGGYDNISYWKFVSDELGSTADTFAGWNVRTALGWTAPAIPCIDGRMPVRGISFYEAVAFSHWQGGYLPTEAQWEVAARLLTGNIFPWGNSFCPSGITITANIGDLQQCAPDPFGGGPGYPEYFAGDISASRCLSLGGNVSEWCMDDFSPSFYTIVDVLRPELVNAPTAPKSVRGGNFASGDRRDATVFSRVPFSPQARQGHIGFRVAWKRGDGDPGNWHLEKYALDCQNPDTIGIWSPNGCLKPNRADSFAIIFSEPMSGNVTTTPFDPINIIYRFNEVPGETLWIIKRAPASIPNETLCIDLSQLTDTVGNKLDTAMTFCIPLCEICFEIIQQPETLWSPQQCINHGTLLLWNCMSFGLSIDSIITYPPFALLGAVSFIPSGDTARLTIRFTPTCSGIITVPIIVFTSEGIFTDSLLGLGCDQPAITAMPSAVDFGEQCEPDSTDILIRITGCWMGTFEICDIYWSTGEFFSLLLIEIGDTIYSSLSGIISYMPRGRGASHDTLYIRFKPLGGMCCDATTIKIPVYAICTTMPCNPSTDYDAVGGSDVVHFYCYAEDIYIYDRRGRFVKRLTPDIDGDATWELDDEDFRPVPSGIYFWKSGKHSGNIIIMK